MDRAVPPGLSFHWMLELLFNTLSEPAEVQPPQNKLPLPSVCIQLLAEPLLTGSTRSTGVPAVSATLIEAEPLTTPAIVNLPPCTPLAPSVGCAVNAGSAALVLASI